MADWNRTPSRPLRHRGPPSSAALLARLPPHPSIRRDDEPLHPRAIIAMEDRLADQHREIQDLLADNQRLAATHVALQQDVLAAVHDLRVAAAASRRAADERDEEFRRLQDRSRMLLTELRATDEMRDEIERVGSDLQSLRAGQEELVGRLNGLREELERAQAMLARAPEIGAEIEALRSEIPKGRAAVENEKKVRTDNIEQNESMEKNMISLAREVEKLRGELANAEKRTRATAAVPNPGAGYYKPGSYGNPEMVYGGTTYNDSYSMQKAQRVADAGLEYGSRGVNGGSQYGSGAVSRGPYDLQQFAARR